MTPPKSCKPMQNKYNTSIRDKSNQLTFSMSYVIHIVVQFRSSLMMKNKGDNSIPLMEDTIVNIDKLHA